MSENVPESFTEAEIKAALRTSTGSYPDAQTLARYSDLVKRLQNEAMGLNPQDCKFVSALLTQLRH